MKKDMGRKPGVKGFGGMRTLTLNSKLCNFITLWKLIKSLSTWNQQRYAIKTVMKFWPQASFKKLIFFNTNVWDRWTCIYLCFYLIIWIIWVFFDAVRNQTSNKVTRVNQKKIKSLWKRMCHMNVLWNFNQL